MKSLPFDDLNRPASVTRVMRLATVMLRQQLAGQRAWLVPIQNQSSSG